MHRVHCDPPDGIEFTLDGTPTDQFDSVLVLLKHSAKWVLVKSRLRGGWEFPGGHRHLGETMEQTARREALEEAAVTIKNIEHFVHYTLTRRQGHRTLVVIADVDEWKPFHGEYETAARELFEKLPADLSFTDGLYEFLIDLAAGYHSADRNGLQLRHRLALII